MKYVEKFGNTKEITRSHKSKDKNSMTKAKNKNKKDWLIDWCLTSSEQFFSYIQGENIRNLNATGLETRKGDG